MPEQRHVPLTERLKNKRVCVCVGAGGVGKTTISAALGLALAADGHKVAVVSIDPARRLATTLGLDELPSEPHRVDPTMLRAHGIEPEGELWALMLDSKGTFDRLVGRLAPDERTREEVMANRIYRELSSSTAGSQEFTAVAKLFELERGGAFDMVVLDTPPSRNALDFLDAPDRLTNFLEGRALRALLPAGLARGLMGRSSGLLLAALGRATGVNLLGELSSFFGSLAGLVDGFSERARGVKRLLRDPATSFVVVSTAERAPSEEAQFFCERLDEAGMSFGALVVNRIHQVDVDEARQERVRGLLNDLVGARLAAKLAGNLADFQVLATRERGQMSALADALCEADPVTVPQLDADVQDLAGLARVVEHLRT